MVRFGLSVVGTSPPAPRTGLTLLAPGLRTPSPPLSGNSPHIAAALTEPPRAKGEIPGLPSRGSIPCSPLPTRLKLLAEEEECSGDLELRKFRPVEERCSEGLPDARSRWKGKMEDRARAASMPAEDPSRPGKVMLRRIGESGSRGMSVPRQPGATGGGDGPARVRGRGTELSLMRRRGVSQDLVRVWGLRLSV